MVMVVSLEQVREAQSDLGSDYLVCASYTRNRQVEMFFHNNVYTILFAGVRVEMTALIENAVRAFNFWAGYQFTDQIRSVRYPGTTICP
jgi:hypothetical protein